MATSWTKPRTNPTAWGIAVTPPPTAVTINDSTVTMASVSVTMNG